MSRKATLELVIKREGVAVAEKSLTQMGATGEAAAKRVQSSMSATDQSVLRMALDIRMLNEQVTRTGVAGTQSFHAFRAPLMGITRQILELNPAVAQLSSALGTFAIGSAWMIGIIAGVAALAYAWDRAGGAAKQAREEQEKARTALESVREKGRSPVLGGLPHEIELEIQHQQDLIAEYTAKAAEAARMKAGYRQGAAAKQAEADELMRQINESKNLVMWGNREVERLNKEHADKVAEDNRQAADKELAEWKAAFQRRIDAMKHTEDELTRIQREGAEARKRSAELNDLGVTSGVGHEPSAVHTPMSMQIPASVFESLARVAERAKVAVERTAHTWEVLADLAQDAVKSKLFAVAGQSGLNLLSTLGGQKGSLASGVISSAMQGFVASGANPIGAAIGGLTALTTGLFGMGKAAREAAEQTRKAQADFQASFALYKQGAFGTVTDTDRALDAERQRYDQYEQQIQSLYGGKKNEAERERLLADAKRAHEAYIAQIKATAAEMEKAAKADGFRKSIEDFTRVIDSLQGFQNELKLGDLSPLSPTQKLAEAKRQYEEILARARGGDISAADQIPQFARAFLEASRSVNASGGAYQRDFQRVQLDTDELSKMFESQRAIAQQQLDVLTGIRDGSVEAAKQTHDDLAGVRDAIERLIDETQSSGEKVESVI